MQPLIGMNVLDELSLESHCGGADVKVSLFGCRYLEGKARLLYPEPEDVFPCDLIDADHCRPPSSYA